MCNRRTNSASVSPDVPIWMRRLLFGTKEQYPHCRSGGHGVKAYLPLIQLRPFVGVMAGRAVEYQCRGFIAVGAAELILEQVGQNHPQTEA